MSMYLSNADLSPVGAEIAQFIDEVPSRPESLPEAEDDAAEAANAPCTRTTEAGFSERVVPRSECGLVGVMWSGELPRSRDESRIEEDGSVVGRFARRPPHAVFAVELSRECATRQRTVEPLLVPPGRVLGMTIESEAQGSVTQEVVDRSETIERTADVGVHQRVPPVAVRDRGGDLEQAVPRHRRDELFGVSVWRGATGEPDAYRSRSFTGNRHEQRVRLVTELCVRSSDQV